MDFHEIKEAYRLFWVDSLFFSGRSTRMEFFVPEIINLIISTVLSFLGPLGGTFNLAFTVVALLPTISNSVRRLHDTGKSALWLTLYLLTGFVYFIPPVGAIVALVSAIILLVIFCQDSEGNNRYGESAKYPNK